MPVGSSRDGESDRPRAVSEYLVERMILGGADKLCFVISPGKTDILEYFGSRIWGADLVYVVQPKPAGLCDALFRAAPLIHAEESVFIGLPDTIWSPIDGFARLPDEDLSFLLFPVEHPELFDAVVLDADDAVVRIEVKQPAPSTRWIWGGIRMSGKIFHELHALWLKEERGDEYLGSLVNAWLDAGGRSRGVAAGRAYVDVGTLHGYRAAIRLLEADPSLEASTQPTLEEF